MGLSRRMLFGRSAAIAAAGAFAPAALGSTGAMQLSGITMAGGAALASNGCAPGSPSRAPLKFLNFASWLKDIGDERIRREAQTVRFIDPDLACMALPLVTKVRWQQDRNYRALLEERQSWFERTIKQDGKVEWWA